MLQSVFWVGLGGMIGSIGRYLIGMYSIRLGQGIFPWGTFIVNIAGCLLIGIIYGITEKMSPSGNSLKLFLATGICGGFTTFSAFGYEGFSLIKNGQHLIAATYIGSSIILGLAAVFAGLYLIKLFNH